MFDRIFMSRWYGGFLATMIILMSFIAAIGILGFVVGITIKAWSFLWVG